MNFPILKSKQLILLLIGVSLISINPRINGWNEASRMALTQSLVERHSFTIDESVFIGSGDKVFIDDHFYSDKPVIPSILGAIAYAPLYAIGLELDYGWNLSYYLIILFTMKVFWIASILAFRKSLAFTPILNKHVPLAVMIFAFASLSFTWSSSFNNHSLAASSLMIGFFYYLRGKQLAEMHSLIWSGFFFGLAASMDMPTSVFLVGFGYLVFQKWRWSKAILRFLAGAVVPLFISLVVNYSIGKTFLPLQINPGFFVFEGSVWTDHNSLSGTNLNSLGFFLQYTFLSLFGVKGFIWYNPLLLILIPVLISNMRRKSTFHTETWVIFIGSLILMAYYFMFSSNYGGWSYSIRWFVPLLPLLIFYVFEMEHLTQNLTRLKVLWSLIICSVVIAIVGLINPWSNQDLSDIPFFANLKQLIGFFS